MENAQLKKRLAEAELDKAMPDELAEGPPNGARSSGLNQLSTPRLAITAGVISVIGGNSVASRPAERSLMAALPVETRTPSTSRVQVRAPPPTHALPPRNREFCGTETRWPTIRR